MYSLPQAYINKIMRACGGRFSSTNCAATILWGGGATWSSVFFSAFTHASSGRRPDAAHSGYLDRPFSLDADSEMEVLLI